MVKNVVSPARISVVNLVFLISKGFIANQRVIVSIEQIRKLTCPDPSRRKIRPKVDEPIETLMYSTYSRMLSIVKMNKA